MVELSRVYRRSGTQQRFIVLDLKALKDWGGIDASVFRS